MARTIVVIIDVRRAARSCKLSRCNADGIFWSHRGILYTYGRWRTVLEIKDITPTMMTWASARFPLRGRREYSVGGAVLTLTIVALAVAGPSFAREIRVEQNGSGEFTSLQDGIDASQPGDVIVVGPGRYDEFKIYEFANGFQVQAIAAVSDGPLTIRGVDRGLVRLGPIVPTDDVEGLLTVGVVVDEVPGGLAIETLSVENVGRPFNILDQATIEDCTIMGGQGVIAAGTTDFRVLGCRIEQAETGILVLSGSPNRGILINGCEIIDNDTGIRLGAAVDAVVQESSIRRTRLTALRLFGGSTAAIRDVDSSDSDVHVFIDDTSSASMSDCVLGSGATIALLLGGVVSGERNFFGGATLQTLDIQGPSAHASLTDGTVLNGGGLTVLAGAFSDLGLGDIDLTDNWWGTTVSKQIDDWIFLGITEGPVVTYEPFKLQPVPTSQESVGTLRARFGGQ